MKEVKGCRNLQTLTLETKNDRQFQIKKKKKKKLKKIIKDLRKLKKEEKLEDLTDDKLMDVAVRILNSERIEKRKSITKANYSTEVTPAQEDFLKGLGYKGNVEDLTKREASKLIKKLQNGKNQKRKSR